MNKYTEKELQEILKLHKMYLENKAGGIKADLSGANLSRADLYKANLSGANLYKANLYKANLSGAYLYEADLSGANLYEANLSEADLSVADLSEANLSKANLYKANLSGANLYKADLSGANLYKANLSKTIYEGVEFKPFQFENHFAFYDSYTLRIGCENHSLKYWSKNIKSIGKKHKYTETQIEKYTDFLKELK